MGGRDCWRRLQLVLFLSPSIVGLRCCVGFIQILVRADSLVDWRGRTLALDFRVGGGAVYPCKKMNRCFKMWVMQLDSLPLEEIG